jgi:hypothetical protein
MGSIKLYKTLRQLQIEKFKPGDIYTCDNNSILQIRKLTPKDNTWSVEYILKLLSIQYTYMYTLDLENFVILLGKLPVSTYIGNEKLWDPV